MASSLIPTQYKDLQRKFRHFEEADQAKFRQVFAMHEQDVAEVAARVVQADRLLHEQLFRWRWEAPATRAVASVVERVPELRRFRTWCGVVWVARVRLGHPSHHPHPRCAPRPHVRALPPLPRSQ